MMRITAPSKHLKHAVTKRLLTGLCVVPLTFIFLFGFAQSTVMVESPCAFSGHLTPSKASYVYNIAKLIDWPAKYKKGAFIIGFVGDPLEYEPFARFINRKTIGNQRVYTTFIENLDDLPACHVMFVDMEDPGTVATIVSGLPNNNTLVISRCKRGLEHGATINLLLQDEKLRFELNEKTAHHHQLFIGSTLRGLALTKRDRND